MDWAGIARKCGTTPGAASKRYSRMKQAFNKGDAATTTPSKSKNDSKGALPSSEGSTPCPKRKRTSVATLKNKNAAGATPDDEEDDDESIDKKSKRNKKKRIKTETGNTPKLRATPKPKSTDKQTPHLPTPTHSSSVNPTEATTLVKPDPDAGEPHPIAVDDKDEDEEYFYDANEVVGGDDTTFTQESELQDSGSAVCQCRANWVAGTVANRRNVGLQEWLEEI